MRATWAGDALQYKQVFRSIQFVALLVVAAVLSGSQCAEICSLVSCEKPVQASELPPCHQHSAPKAPAKKDCAHPEIVAEKRTVESDLAGARVLPVFIVEAGDLIAPSLNTSPLAIETAPPLGITRTSSISVLRI